MAKQCFWGKENAMRVKKEDLVEWLTNTEEGRAAFERECGSAETGRTPASYLAEYAYRDGIVEALASDAGYPGPLK